MESRKPLSVLLADDSQTFLMYLGLLIKRLGYHILLARDGVETLKIAKEKHPAIIILDYMMPKIDGSSCLSIIRNDSDLKNTPVIILTSHESSRDDFERLGCCYFLRKPVNVTEFYSALRGCINTKIPRSNNRRHLRVPMSLMVSVECLNEKRELYASTLSEEGMFLRTVAPFDTGTVMNIVFSIDDEDPLELKGKVVYSTRLSTELEPEPGMGIQFIDLPEDIRCKLSYFVMSEITEDLSVEGADLRSEIGFDYPANK